MKLLVNAAQMKAADQYTIQELGIRITGINGACSKCLCTDDAK